VKEVIYLRVSRHRVEGMTKRLPDLQRGDIPVKLTIEVDDAAFREPVIEHRVHVTDWRQGMDLPDLDLRDGIITEQEAGVIRARRLAAMRKVLEEHGYAITEPATDGEAADA
jgi:hypothetical protein